VSPDEAPLAAVTGAASGVGYAVTATLLRMGWAVAAIDRAPIPDELAAIAPDRLLPLACDLRDPEAIRSTFAEVGVRFSGMKALICCAGVLLVAPMDSMAVGEFDLIFDVNTRAPWLCTQAALPLLRLRTSAADPARIIIVSSLGAVRPKVGVGIYSASKAAVSQMVRTLAVELARDHLLVNAIEPGSMDTPMRRAARAKVVGGGYQPSSVPPLGRAVEPQDVANAVKLLLSADAAFITGIALVVDGGANAAYQPGSGA
jgi:NAD(P)-dependent dehydrogenase (short-subunit alcohol dehydrogenase family)